MANQLKSFTVMAKVTIDCDISIRAESLEDAVFESAKLKEKDFVEIRGNFNDGNLKITGCYEND